MVMVTVTVMLYSKAATPKAAAPTTPVQSWARKFAAPEKVEGAGAALLATLALLVAVGAGVVAGTLLLAEADGRGMVTLAEAQNCTANWRVAGSTIYGLEFKGDEKRR